MLFFGGNEKLDIERYKSCREEKEKNPAKKPGFDIHGSPNGGRTRVAGVRGRYPKPLDDGTVYVRIR